MNHGRGGQLQILERERFALVFDCVMFLLFRSGVGTCRRPFKKKAPTGVNRSAEGVPASKG
uniref:hypothetical protein n=1 Tax=Burkholderia vietnamiensis TaxID=60552 RepID=UPI000AE35C09|nr:hypothetical protein [Burkholderia vietnamiensis]